jgi:hypothetical protein
MAGLTRKEKLEKLNEFVQKELPESKYEVNNLVWAKTKVKTRAKTRAKKAKTTNYGNWPAKIIEKHVENKKFYTVRFFDNEKLTVNENKIISKVNDNDNFKNDDKDKCTKHIPECETAIMYGNKDIDIRKIIEDIKENTERKPLTKEENQNEIYNTVSDIIDKINDNQSDISADVSDEINDNQSDISADVSDEINDKSIDIIKKFYTKENVNIEPTDIDENTKEIIADYIKIYFRSIIIYNKAIPKIVPEIVPEILQDYNQVIGELILNRENFEKHKDILRTGLKLILKILVPDYYEETEVDLRTKFNEAIKSKKNDSPDSSNQSPPRKKQKRNSIIYNLTKDILTPNETLYGVNKNVVIDFSNLSSQKSSNNSGQKSKRAHDSSHSSRSNNKKAKNKSPTTQESSDSEIEFVTNITHDSSHSSRSNNKKVKNKSPTTQESSDSEIKVISPSESSPDIDTKIANAKKELEAKNKELEAKNKELEAKNKELDELEERKKQMTEISNTKKKLEAKNKELKAKNKELEELKENINQINKEIKGNNNILLSLFKKKELTAKNKELEELKENIIQITKEIEELKSKIVVTNGGKPKSTKPDQKPKLKSKPTKTEQKPKLKSKPTKTEQKPKSKSTKPDQKPKPKSKSTKPEQKPNPKSNKPEQKPKPKSKSNKPKQKSTKVKK